jgi:hypothetical protein
MASTHPARIPGYTLEYLYNPEDIPVFTTKYRDFFSALETIGIPQSAMSFLEFQKAMALPKHTRICRGFYHPSKIANETILVLVKKDDTIVGAVALDYYSHSREIYVNQICVSDEAKGIGKSLLAVANDVGKQLGATRVRLQVGINGTNPESNKKLFNWYASQGFNYESEENKKKKSLSWPKVSKAITRKTRRTSRNSRRSRSRK